MYSAIRASPRRRNENGEFFGETSNSARAVRNGGEIVRVRRFYCSLMTEDYFAKQRELNVGRAAGYGYRALHFELGESYPLREFFCQFIVRLTCTQMPSSELNLSCIIYI